MIKSIKKYIDGALTLKKWIKSGGALVSPHLAIRRSNICAVCPMNIKSNKLVFYIARIVRVFVGLKSRVIFNIKTDRKLGRCASCSCELQVKLWMPIDSVKPDKKDFVKFDPNCWLLNEKQNESNPH